MKNVLPHITRTRYLKPQPPEPYFLVGLSSRRKIMRAFQLWYHSPPVTEETSQFTPFFEYLADGVPDRWEVQQEYAACNFATNYDDKDLATSLLLHFGYAPDYKIPLPGSSQHKITVHPTGVALDIEYTHTFQDRMDAACAAINAEIDRCIHAGWTRDPNKLISTGMIAFSLHNKRYISVNKDYRMMVTNKMVAYIEERLNALAEHPPMVPEIHEPEDLLPDQAHFIEFSKFVIPDGVSDLQRTQRRDNGKDILIKTLMPKIAHLPRDTHLTRADFPDTIDTNTYTSAVRLGVLIRIKQGTYLIPSPDYLKPVAPTPAPTISQKSILEQKVAALPLDTPLKRADLRGKISDNDLKKAVDRKLLTKIAHGTYLRKE